MPNLIGTGPDQVPTNGLLGSMAFQDAENASFLLSGNATQALEPVSLQQLQAEEFGRLQNIQVFAAGSTGNYTPTPGTLNVLVRAVGGGAGSSGFATTTTGQVAYSRPGRSGGAFEVYLPVGTISNAAYSVGSGGTGGTAGQTAGTSGGDTTIGGFIATGGTAAVASPAVAANTLALVPGLGFGNVNTIPSGKILMNIRTPGVNDCVSGNTHLTIGSCISNGFSSVFPQAFAAGITSSNFTLSVGNGFGGAASGGWVVGPNSALAGANGAGGILIIYEYA